MEFVKLAEQPPDDIEFYSADDVFVKQMWLKNAGTYVPQHSHTYAHMSMLAKGSVRLWKDGVLQGDFTAPTGIHIEAGAKHLFLSLEPETIVYCIHNTSRSGEVDIAEEHQIVGG